MSAEIFGAGALHAVTLVLAFADPPPPVQVRLYVAVAETVTALEPDGPSEPFHPPEAVQPLAFIDDQVSVTCPFTATSFAEAESCAVGGIEGVEEPPPPPQAESSATIDAINHRAPQSARRAPSILMS